MIFSKFLLLALGIHISTSLNIINANFPLMKATITTIATVLLLLPVAQTAYAETIPAWIKNNAAWWADGTISENEFLNGIQYLIKENILVVPPAQLAAEQTDSVPDWVKNNAKWWSDGTISDGEFLNAIQHLIKIGIISVATDMEAPSEQMQPAVKKQTTSGTEMAALEAELEACQEIKKAYDRLKCEDKVKEKILTLDYKTNGEVFTVGPLNVYFKGADLDIQSSGKANLYISMLAENARSDDNITMMCTGPAICNYDVVSENKVFKYSSQDFTNGQIVLKPGEAREFNMLFGPNIGYGGTEFVYDSSKSYSFRISEPWGSIQIPLELG